MLDIAFVIFIGFCSDGPQAPVLLGADLHLHRHRRAAEDQLGVPHLAAGLAGRVRRRVRGWLFFDTKHGSRFTLRQAMILVLLAYCGWTTLNAQYPVEALTKWDWVWKALLFARSCR
jgi:hypothetical protein